MGRSPCCSKVGLRRGPWSTKEDTLLSNFIQQNGQGQWRSLPKKAGLLRCGKSCRLRWMNYLRPGIKRGNISQDEEDLIVRMHGLLGNRWSLIAGRLPGRTDNEIKNYWNTHLLKKLHTAGAGIHPAAISHINKEYLTNNKRPAANKKKEIPSTNAIGPKRKKKQQHKRAARAPPDQLEAAAAAKIENDDGEQGKRTKVYLPRPIRVSSVFSRTNSYDSLASGVSSSDGSGGAAEKVGEVASYVPVVAWPPLFELEEAGYGGGRGGDEDDFLGVGFILPLLHRQSDSISGDVNMLEQVYDEYLQLL